MSNDGKYAAEIEFWTEELDRYVRWYRRGMREFYGVPAPNNAQRVTRHADIRRNALETWVNADRWRYCKHLWVPPTYFDGRTVLEVGPGPLGLSQWFAGAVEIVGVEPLYNAYLQAGYPVDEQRIQYIPAKAESIPVGSNSIDAAFSVNAIDHVDDFAAVCRELERVVKPDGEIRIEVHYHAATTTEPCVLSDDIVASAFQKFQMTKLIESPSTTFYPPGTHPSSDRFALWGNRSHLFDAVEALR